MQINSRVSRGVAFLTGAVLASSMLVLPMQGAQAADKSKTYKAGAIGLGVLGAYFGIKGKTVPAVVAGAGAYYAYKKGKDVENNRTAQNPSGDVYPDDARARSKEAPTSRRDDVYASNSGVNEFPVEDSVSSDNDLGYVSLNAKSDINKTDSAIVLK